MTQATSPIAITDKGPRLARLVAICIGAPLAVVGLWSLAAIFHSVVLAILAGAASIALTGAAAWYIRKALRWNLRLWAGQYLCTPRPRFDPNCPIDLCFLFVDHFEPDHGRASPEQQVERVRAWEESYRDAIGGHADSDGRCPQHTWFLPISQTAEDVRTVVSQWPTYGWGEMEYHLHHDDQPQISNEDLRRRIVTDIGLLQKCGAVTSGRYSFVHGMFALAGGDPLYCRKENEIDLLLATGCYADFTFPDMESPGQPSQVNSIFYARTNGHPKPHDCGEECRVGARHDGLLIIQGPMCFGLHRRMLDDAQVEPDYPPHPSRIRRWLDAHVHVRGRPNWVFIAVHSHTGIERGRAAVFGGQMQRLWAALESRFKHPNTRLHYVTAREAYNIIKAAEAGHDGNPAEFRDFDVPPPANRQRPATSMSPPQGKGTAA